MHASCEICIIDYSDAPIYESPPPKYAVEEILDILLQPSSKICFVRPVNIKKSATYVIDITKLHHPDDAKKDNFGRWEHVGSHTTLFKVQQSGDVMEIEKCASEASDCFKLRRLYSRHPSNQGFRRILAFVTGM